jgi:hypothetical protein
MTMANSLRSGLSVKVGTISTDPAPQLSQFVTLSATVDGVACSMVADGYKGCGFYRFTVNGVNWVDTPLSHGQGIQWAHNILPTGYLVSSNACSPTEGGNAGDGSTVVTGTSNNTYRALSADGRRLVRKTLGAYWDRPYQVTATFPGLNDRLVASDMPVVQDTVWGWNGDDHIIQFLSDTYVANVPLYTGMQQLDLVGCSVYATQAVLDVIELLDPATGAVTAYAGFPAKSLAADGKVMLASSADGTKAMCVYEPFGEWGSTGYAQQIFTAGLNNFFIRAREESANITPGVRRLNKYLIFGSKAQVITSTMAVHAANPTRSTNIALPDF